MFDENSRLNSSISAWRQCSSWSPRIAFAYVNGDPSGARLRDDAAEADVAVVLLRVTGGSGRVLSSDLCRAGKGMFGAIASVGGGMHVVTGIIGSDCATLIISWDADTFEAP